MANLYVGSRVTCMGYDQIMLLTLTIINVRARIFELIEKLSIIPLLFLLFRICALLISIII